MRSKYDDGQEKQTRTPESSDVSKVKIPKFSEGKSETGLGCDGGGDILQRRPPTDAQ